MTALSDRRVVAVIQARTGSSRYPRKVLHHLGDRTVLEWCIRAAEMAAGVDDVLVATTEDPSDDDIVKIATRAGAQVFRGSEDDVLDRFLGAGDYAKADALVRLTADCPLLDPVLVSQVVAMWRQDPSLEYVSTTLQRTLPRGLDVELASMTAIRSAAANATGYHRVHVTSWLYAPGNEYKRMGLVIQPNRSDLRVTLDTREDAIALDQLVDVLDNSPSAWQETIRSLVAHPEIVAINRSIRQKALNEG